MTAKKVGTTKKSSVRSTTTKKSLVRKTTTKKSPLKKTTTKKSPSKTAKPADTEKEIARFIAKFSPLNAALIRDCRAQLRRRLPTAFELIYDNYNFLVFAFCTTARPSSSILSLAADSNGTTLMLYHGADITNLDGVMQGVGKQNRYIRLPSVATLAEPAVQQIITAAVAITVPALAKSGNGPTVIQAVSPTQRPRRKIGE